MAFISPTFSFIISMIACLLAIYCVWEIYTFNKLRKVFFTGKQAGNLENVIMVIAQKLEEEGQRQAVLEQALSELKHQTTFSIQKVGLVRFNPFNDGGGNFSFSLALLDAYNSGVVITSMYGREQNRIYTKKIVNGKTDSALNEEELKAVSEANSNLK